MKKKYKTNDPYELADLSWGFIVFLWFCWWPLGLGLTVGKLIHQQKRQQANRYIPSSPYNYRPAADVRQQRDYEGTLRAAANAQPQPQARPNTGVDIPSPEQSKAAQKRGWLTPFFLVMGALLGLGGLSIFLEGVGYLLPFTGSMWPITDNIIPGLLMATGGGAMFRTGLHNRKLAKQEALLDTIVGPRANVTLDELSAASGLGKKETLKVVQSAIAHGRFGADAYVDMATRTLVVRGAAPVAPAKAPAAKKSTAKQPKEDKYQAILRQLRQANEAIPGQAMSAKIDRMELVSARIFELAKQDPNKESQLSRFMDYYLPTALKLLNTYAELDRPGLTGENINETKLGIEQAMDLLVTAFENQLDKLYESDALDVSSEISALQGMMNLDGLTPSADFDTAPRGGTGR